MNVKIKSAGVSCLVGNDYDQVYSKLKKELGEGDDLLFTERTPGHGYLQWELPGDGWESLAEGDPLMAQEVRKELDHRKQLVADRFGANRDFAMRLMTVPDDTYIYYKPDAAGRLIIKLTAWGYRYPERVGTGNISGIVKPKVATEHVVIRVEYDDQPVPGKDMTINGFRRFADLNGILDVGDLPVGYTFELEVGGRKESVTVEPGKGEIKIDLTEYVTIEVNVSRDGLPANGANVRISYSGRDMQLVTDAAGRVSAKLPLAINGAPIMVSVENEFQQLPAVMPLTSFNFNLVTPKPESDPDEDDEKDAGDEGEDLTGSDEGQTDRDDETQEGETPGDDADEDEPSEVGEEKEEEKEGEKEEDNDGKTNSQVPWWWGLLGILALLALLIGTYAFCYGMLFGN